MSSQSIYRINNPSVIGEVLDGEAIIVNLDSGFYYSLDGVGADVWTVAQSGATLADMIKQTTARFSGEPAVIAAEMTALVTDLLAEGLLVADDAVIAPMDDHSTGSTVPSADRPPFVTPILHKYTDMADLLLLDPIHEVEEQGWPHRATHA